MKETIKVAFAKSDDSEGLKMYYEISNEVDGLTEEAIITTYPYTFMGEKMQPTEEGMLTNLCGENQHAQVLKKIGEDKYEEVIFN